MERDLKLKEFAGELFSYIYREYNSTFDLPVKLPHVFNHHAAENFSEDEGRAVLRLCVALRSVFGGAFTKAFAQIQKSVKHFMTFLTSRCLKFCGDDLFLSFLMICAFIAELNLFCWVNGCYAFMSTAPKCLIAIFNRRLNKEFYATGGWEKLKQFCESFVQTNGNVAEYSNDDFINQDLLSSIEELLDQNSSSEEDSSSDSDESSSDEMEEEVSNEGVAPSQDKVEEEEEDEEDSDDESSMESDESDSESEESAVEMAGGLNHTTVDGDSEDESESSEEDPSSMSGEEESETEDSESDTAPDAEQVNCIKPVMQENLSIEKKLL